MGVFYSVSRYRERMRSRATAFHAQMRANAERA